MHGGELFAEIVMVAVLTIGAGWLIWMMATAQDMRREDERAHGDVARLPAEFRLPSNKAGERPRKAGEPGTGHVRTHDSGASTR